MKKTGGPAVGGWLIGPIYVVYVFSGSCLKWSWRWGYSSWIHVPYIIIIIIIIIYLPGGCLECSSFDQSSFHAARYIQPPLSEKGLLVSCKTKNKIIRFSLRACTAVRTEHIL